MVDQLVNHSLKMQLISNSNLGNRLGRLGDHQKTEIGDHDLGQHDLVDVLLVVLLVLGLVVAGLELRRNRTPRSRNPKPFESKFRKHCASKLDGALRKSTLYV